MEWEVLATAFRIQSSMSSNSHETVMLWKPGEPAGLGGLAFSQLPSGGIRKCAVLPRPRVGFSQRPVQKKFERSAPDPAGEKRPPWTGWALAGPLRPDRASCCGIAGDGLRQTAGG